MAHFRADKDAREPGSFVDAVHRLRTFYGLLPTLPGDLFQFFVWEILSRDALPARRDLAWLALKRIPALTPDAVFRAPPKAFLDAIGLTGPYREDKADLIKSVVGEFKRHRDTLAGDAFAESGLRRAVRALRRFTLIDIGVRRRALLFAGNYLLLPMDPELARVLNRIAGSEPVLLPRRQTAPEQRRSQRGARRWLADRLPRDLEIYRDAVVYLRHHAQHTCLLIGPHCTVCPLRDGCVAGTSSVTPPAGAAP